MTTYTLQPDAAGLDTYITSSLATTNYGTAIYMAVGASAGIGANGRTLLKFDLSSIPASLTVSSATLTLYVAGDFSSNARTLSVYRQKKAWVEAQATWNIYSTGNNWTTAGGFDATDCEQSAIGTVTQPASPSVGDAISVTLDAAKVQEWLSGAFTNNGMLIRVDTENTDAIAYDSSDGTTAGERPKLVIIGEIPGGGCAFTCIL